MATGAAVEWALFGEGELVRPTLRNPGPADAARPPDEAGGVLLVEGPLACGKTTVVRDTAEHAAERGTTVLLANCARAERELQFGVVAQLFRAAGLPMDLPQVAEPDEAAIVRLGHRFCTRLLELAERQPLLIAIDDLRHADVPSAMCLAQLLRRVGQTAITMVVSDDSHLRSSYPPLRAELARLPGASRIELAPLTPDAITRMLVEQLDIGPDDECPTDLWKATGGNPLLMRALVDDYLDTGEPREQGYGQAFLSCLYRNESILLDTVRALAVLDADSSTAELARVVGTDPVEVAQALHAMTEAGLLHGGTFRHDVARLSVLNELPADVRAELHHRAAQLLYDQGMPAVTVAHHLVAAGPMDTAWSQDVLLEAAELAALAANAGFAVELLELALRSCTDARTRAAVAARLVEIEWRINPSTAARHLGPLVDAAGSGRLTVPETVALVRQLLWRGRIGEAERLLAGLREDPALAGELHSVDRWLTCTYPPLAGRGARPPADHGLQAAREGALQRAGGVLADVLVRGQRQEIKPRAEEVLRELHLGHSVAGQEEGGLLAVLALIYTDQLEAAGSWCDVLLQEAESRRLPMWRSLFSACKAEIAVRQGNLAAAADLANRAFTDASPGSWAAAVGFPLGSLILAHTRMGQLEKAARNATQSIPVAALQNRHGLHYLYARGHYFLAVERGQAALADFMTCGELMDAWGIGRSSLVPWRTSAAEAWLSLGNRDQAKRLILEQLARPGADGNRTRALSLRLLAETSSAKRRPQLLTEAIDLLEERGDKYELARALRDQSRAQHAIGKQEQARRVVRRAWYVANSCNAKPLCDELLPNNGDEFAQATAAVAQRPERIQLLTDSERRVASLASIGYTNREIAGRLYVTASTVEQHLTRVFRKLDVKRREELPEELGS
jgi:DNA-binding CsgD family transcriptional regulator